jgi:hypothetical protein
MAQSPWLSFGQFETVPYQDKDGSPVVNSAGDPFDPPLMRDDSRPILTYKRNQALFIPSMAQQYRDAVNSDSLLGADPKTVKIADVQCEMALDPIIGVYNRVSWEFHFASLPNGWKFSVLDQGCKQLNSDSSSQEVINFFGTPTNSPVLLDGNGSPLPPGEDPVFLTFEGYDELSFAALNIQLPFCMGGT